MKLSVLLFPSASESYLLGVRIKIDSKSIGSKLCAENFMRPTSSNGSRKDDAPTYSSDSSLVCVNNDVAFLQYT